MPSPKSNTPPPAVVARDSVRSDTAKPDTVHKDSVAHAQFHIPKGGEVTVAELPPLDTVQPPLREMPPQGPDSTEKPTPDIPQLPSPKDTIPPSPPNLQRFLPSSLLQRGQWEVKAFQQLYSQTHYFDAQAQAQPQNARSSYYTGIGSVLLGVNTRLNLGAEIWIRSADIGPTDASLLRPLRFQNGLQSRAAIAAAGPKLKFLPFRSLPDLTVQSALLLPLGRDMEGHVGGGPYLATENLQWWTQAYYSHAIHRKWLLFLEVDAYATVRTGGREQGQPSSFALPVSAFMNFFPTRRITGYGMVQVWPTLNSLWVQAGVGAKLKLTNSIELDAMYGRFVAGVAAAGPADAINFGVRIVHW